MDNRRDVQEYLTALRARLTPETAGLTIFGGERRVPGLRREEVAQLAGVSTAYYTRMERGDLSGVSDSVLYALARGLQLNEAETTHLLDLARAAAPSSRQPRRNPVPKVRRGSRNCSMQCPMFLLSRSAASAIRSLRRHSHGLGILAQSPPERGMKRPGFDGDSAHLISTSSLALVTPA